AIPGLISPHVLSITEGALRAMFIHKLKVAGAGLLAVALLGTGFGLWVGPRSHAGGQPPARAEGKGPPAPAAANPPAEAQQAAAKQARENLKQLALAMHNYHDMYNALPTSAIYAADGTTPLLSWRVALLPFLGEKK